MKFLRSIDTLSHSLSSSQARMFENSVNRGIPSKLFIRSFLLSKEAKLIDDLNLEVDGLSEAELFDTIDNKIHTRKGIIYPFSVMHYIGYFYRMAAYLTGYSSAELYHTIKPDLLYQNYRTIHSLAIEDAIKEMFEITNTEIEDKYSLFKKIYKIDL